LETSRATRAKGRSPTSVIAPPASAGNNSPRALAIANSHGCNSRNRSCWPSSASCVTRIGLSGRRKFVLSEHRELRQVRGLDFHGVRADMRRAFPHRLYRRRALIKSVFSSVKRKCSARAPGHASAASPVAEPDFQFVSPEASLPFPEESTEPIYLCVARSLGTL
jgi:hypothetical protein